MTAPVTDRNLLDLHMPVDPNGTAAAVAPLAWCVTKTLLERVEKEGFKNPHLLVINRVKKTDAMGSTRWTAYTDKSATFIPLSNAMTYLSFTQDGENELHAYVVDIADKHDAKRARVFADEISKWRGHEFLSKVDDEHFVTDLSLRKLKATSEMLTVHVPAEMFAPPPAEWRKKIVKRFFKTRQVDQCHFRKHFMVALPLAAILAPLMYLVKAIFTAVYYAFGGRGFAVKGAFKSPLAWPSHLWRASPNQWWAPGQDSDHKDRLSIWSVLNALALGAIGLVLLGLNAFGWGKTLIIAAVLLTLAGLFVGISAILTSDKFKSAKYKREKAAQEAYRQKQLKMLESMLCETNLPANSLKDLPKDKQTVTLRFYDFKTKVCKPFAR